MAFQHRICIFLAGGIGDFIASMPAMLRVRRHFSQSRVVLVGNPLWLPLAREFEVFDEVRSLDDLPLHAGFLRQLPKDHLLHRFLAGFDRIISWFGDREGQWGKTLESVCPGRVLVQPLHKVHAFEGHVSDYYLTTLKAWGLTEQDGTNRGQHPLPFGRRETLSAACETGAPEARKDPFLCLHPGSGSEKKNWPRENFLALARGAFSLWRLCSTVLIGPAEGNQSAFWSKAAHENALWVNEDLPILEVCRILQRATVYVGNDSGITHLAAALGTPVIALFGPTDPARWAPRGCRVEILSHQNSPEEILAVIGRFHSSIIL